MNNGQYYRSAELVDLIHKNFSGFHAGYRGVHASGRYYAAIFKASGEAGKISRAAHFQGAPVSATVRYSNAPSGYPFRPANATSMAVKFYLEDGTVTDIIALPIPLFVARHPDEVFELLTASTPDATTGNQDIEKVQGFFKEHPWLLPAFQAAMSIPASTSFAQTPYHPLHAFRFVNRAGESVYGRYHWMPVAGAASQSVEQLQALAPNYLFEELEERLRKAPVYFDLVLQLAADDDPTDDPSAAWPEDRIRVKLGSLEIHRPTSVEEIGDPVMLHDPTRVTDGIELTDDPILAARRGIYEVSVAHRTGGWKGRQAATELAGCPFMGVTKPGHGR
ncbi:MAG: catalase [Silvibacterium sp.]